MYGDIKVTLGVCVRNCEDLIEETIKSIINQDFPHNYIEVIFVDDGSLDGTPSIIQNYLPELDMRARYFHHKWKGLGATRNVVINHADGKYIVWVDGDIRLSKDFVEKQVAFMDANPRVGIAKGRYGALAQASLVGDLENMDFVVTGSRPKEKTYSVPLGTGGSIYRVEAIRGVGGFDPSIKGSGEDVDAEYRIRKAAWSFDLTSAVFYERRRTSWRAIWNEYYWHGSGSSSLFGKDRRIVDSYSLWPPLILMIELLRVGTAYKLTGRKTALLLPIHYIFKRTAWFLGFVWSRLRK